MLDQLTESSVWDKLTDYHFPLSEVLCIHVLVVVYKYGKLLWKNSMVQECTFFFERKLNCEKFRH